MDSQVGRVLAEVWRGTGGYVFLPAKSGGKWLESSGHIWPRRTGTTTLSVIDSADQYFCPLVFSQPRRKAEYALPTHVLWADLDEADPRKCALRPSVAWQTTQGGISADDLAFAMSMDTDTEAGMEVLSSMQSEARAAPHWQALWLLGTTQPSFALGMDIGPPVAIPAQHSRQIISAQAAASLSKRIAYAEPGADRSGWDVTQVLRLPGTLNHKHTPPQPVKLLWAKRLYYTVEQVRSAYPPVPKAHTSSSNGAAGWHEFTPAEIAAALRALPMGVQMALERDDGGADRSLELFRLARELLTWKVAPDMAAALLEMSALGRSKYGSRTDGRQRLLTTVADAMLEE